MLGALAPSVIDQLAALERLNIGFPNTTTRKRRRRHGRDPM